MRHPLTATYGSMVQRCHNPKNPHFRNYGAKGITVCERWRGRKIGFANFIADMGPKPTPAHTLDRINNNLGYTPENCRWATRREQLLNTSRTHIIVDDAGDVHTSIELAEQYGLSDQVIRQRHRQGKSFAEIISQHHLDLGYDRLAEGRALAAALNRSRTHCKWGHELTPENTIINGNKRGCRECNRLKQQSYYHRINPGARNYKPKSG